MRTPFNSRFGLFLLVLLLVLIIAWFVIGRDAVSWLQHGLDDYVGEKNVLISEPTWPLQELPTGDALTHGFDQAELDKLTAFLQDEGSYINSFLIVHGGEIIYEQYGAERSAEMIENVWSVSKSFTSALTGIALQNGNLTSLNQTVGELLPANLLQDSDPQLKQVTIRQLLAMTSGSYCRGDSCSGQSLSQVLARDLRSKPGSKWVYDTSTPQILSAILAEVSDQATMQAFGEKALFEPLGFATLEWEVDTDGVTAAGRGLYIRPRDMAKLGQLYLDDGVWNGERLISADYIAQSTQNYVPDTTEPVYGYLWWLGNTLGYPAYTALGYGGQNIFIVPDLDLTVVITSDKQADYENRPLIDNYVIPAFIIK